MKGQASLPHVVWIAIAILTVQALVLYAMGQPLICRCGVIKLWGGVGSGPEISQHLSDWYTYSHVIHGIGFHALLWLVMPRAQFALKFAIAVGIEAGWEIFENTPLIIERYRQSAIAQGYFGDSIVNSLSDSLAMAVGFILARMLPVWATVALVVATELFAGYMIRDNLMLNIIQLVHPSELISRWQMEQ